MLLPLLVVDVAEGGCQGEWTNPTTEQVQRLRHTAGQKHMIARWYAKVVSMLAFASVFNLLYFLPEAPSTILSRQGLITCCGVSTIAAHFCK